ncbi:MAG: hypothetical protein P1V36_15755 [Planctomycetota bacterium]|nr:hypothetical protein [Planctomycetota bacterium]
MQASTMGKGVLALVVIAVFSGVLMEQAGAIPPPPRFREFTIINSTPQEVAGVMVEFWPTNPNDRGQLGPSFTISISRLPAGKSVVFSTGPGTQGIEGIAKIQARASCPMGNPLPMPAEIIAPKGDYTSPPDGVLEYAGFCSNAPSGQTDYKPTLEFRVNPSTQKYQAVLHAKWRWNEAWPPAAVEGVSTFPNNPDSPEQSPPGDD